tara:strand:- start:1201 stop:1590 length:390 start_codon:yes stop_codon:yes gene_type:complete
MAGFTRVHPTATPTLPVSMGGSTEEVTYIEIDYLADASGKTGPESALPAVYNLMGTFGTVVYLGPLFDSSTRQIIGIEGLTQDTGIADFAAMTVVQAAVQALGTVDSLALGSATAIRGGPSAALQDAIS